MIATLPSARRSSRSIRISSSRPAIVTICFRSIAATSNGARAASIASNRSSAAATRSASSSKSARSGRRAARKILASARSVDRADIRSERGEVRSALARFASSSSSARCVAVPRSLPPSPRRHDRELAGAEAVLAERAHRATRLAPEHVGAAADLRAGERRRAIRDRLARSGAERAWRSVAAGASSSGQIANRGARLGLVVVELRGPARDECADTRAQPLEPARAAQPRVLRRGPRHSVRALQRPRQERIAARGLRPARIREPCDPGRFVARAHVVDATEHVDAADRQRVRHGALERALQLCERVVVADRAGDRSEARDILDRGLPEQQRVRVARCVPTQQRERSLPGARPAARRRGGDTVRLA